MHRVVRVVTLRTKENDGLAGVNEAALRVHLVGNRPTWMRALFPVPGQSRIFAEPSWQPVSAIEHPCTAEAAGPV